MSESTYTFRCEGCKSVYDMKHETCPECGCRNLVLCDSVIHGPGPLTQDEKVNGAILLENIPDTALLKTMFCGVPCAAVCKSEKSDNGEVYLYPLYLVVTEDLANYMRGPTGEVLTANDKEPERDLRLGMSSIGTNGTGNTPPAS